MCETDKANISERYEAIHTLDSGGPSWEIAEEPIRLGSCKAVSVHPAPRRENSKEERWFVVQSVVLYEVIGVTTIRDRMCPRPNLATSQHHARSLAAFHLRTI